MTTWRWAKAATIALAILVVLGACSGSEAEKKTRAAAPRTGSMSTTTLAVSANASNSTTSVGTPTARTKSATVAAPTGPVVPDGFRLDLDSRSRPWVLTMTRYDFTERRELAKFEEGTTHIHYRWSLTAARGVVGYCGPGAGCQVRTVSAEGRLSESIDDGHFPSWSPDGRWLLVTKPGVADNGELWVVPRDGGRAIRVAADLGAKCCDEYGGSVAQWSPDSSLIAYPNARTGAVHVVAPDGRGARVFFDPQAETGRKNPSVLWAPDSERLAVGFNWWRTSEQPDPDYAVAVLNVDSGDWAEVPGRFVVIGWMPDGRGLVVREPLDYQFAQRGCSSRLLFYTVALDGSARREFGHGCPGSVSPDGATLVFSNGRQIFTASLVTSDESAAEFYVGTGQSRENFGRIGCCEWAPDSSAVGIRDDFVVVRRVDGRGEWRSPTPYR